MKGALWIFNPVTSTNGFGSPLAISVLVHHWKLSRVMVSAKSWPLLCLASLLIFILCPAGHAVEEIDSVLDKQESDIKALAGFVLQNYLNASELAQGCAVNCSRRNCQPLTTDNYACAYVPDNLDCRQQDNSSCTSTMLDWSQSVVIGSPDANLENESPNCDMRKTICAQKQLDTQFFTKEERSTDLVAGQTYFGASNGLQRLYPAKEWNQTACLNFELRGRPWYVAATALSKDIVVMLDYGQSSGQALTLDDPTVTVFAAMKNITSRMLKTLTYEDSISIFTLANTALAVGVRTSVINSPSTGVNASIFDPLNAEIQSLEDPGQQSNTMGQANLTTGLNAALDQFRNQFEDSSILKTVIFLTTGDFTGEYLDETLVEALETAEVTVFIFRVLSTVSSGGNDSITTQLRNATCVISGGYGEQPYDGQDPYAILQPFYSYVARLRFEQNGQKPYWVPKFTSYSSQGQVIAVAIPVFDGDILVGVVSRNIFVDYLQNITSNWNPALGRRNLVSTLPLTINKSIINLCNQVGPDRSCPAILSTGGSGVTGFCTNVNTSWNPLDLLCCRDECPWPFSTGGGSDTTNVLKIALPVALSAALVLISTICLGCWWTRNREKNRRPIIPPRKDNNTSGEARSDDMFRRYV